MQWSARSATDIANDGGIDRTYGQTYGTLPTPVRAGYTFGGWYKETSFTNKVTSSNKVTTNADHTLYAKWTKN